jgi:hypothetical protein
VTVINKFESKDLPRSDTDDKPRILDAAKQRISCHDLTVIGVGSAKRASSVAYFLALSWPSAMQFRSELGLPTVDFHITLGFDNADVFNISKGITSIFAPSAALGLPHSHGLDPPISTTLLPLCARLVEQVLAREDSPAVEVTAHLADLTASLLFEPPAPLLENSQTDEAQTELIKLRCRVVISRAQALARAG